MIQKQNIYISYHHDENKNDDYWIRQDFEYKKMFEEMCKGKFEVVNNSVVESNNRYKTIREEHMQDSSVTVVLIGVDSWRQKSIDWEIASSIKKPDKNKGLVGILLPTYKKYLEKKLEEDHKYEIDEGIGYFDKRTIPERLMLNLENRYAKIYDWVQDANQIQKWITEAYYRRYDVIPDNSLKMFKFDRMRLVS